VVKLIQQVVCERRYSKCHTVSRYLNFLTEFKKRIFPSYLSRLNLLQTNTFIHTLTLEAIAQAICSVYHASEIKVSMKKFKLFGFWPRPPQLPQGLCPGTPSEDLRRPDLLTYNTSSFTPPTKFLPVLLQIFLPSVLH
jgi:hypothetical protein